MMRRHVFLLTLFTCSLLAGCGKSPPPLTEVEGTLLLNDQPLPMAHVEFFPELTHFGSQWNSSAVTDAKGQFTLTCGNGKPGAVVATHRVIVIDAPPPSEARGMDGESQARLGRYVAGLTNRPIPEKYGNYSQTPLRVEVKADQKAYVIKMTR